MLSFQLNAAAGSGEVNSKIKFAEDLICLEERSFSSVKNILLQIRLSRERILPVMRVLSYWS